MSTNSKYILEKSDLASKLLTIEFYSYRTNTKIHINKTIQNLPHKVAGYVSRETYNFYVKD